MPFDLTTWQHAAADKLGHIGRWLDRRTADAPFLAYGTLGGLALWPLVEAARSGQLLPVAFALGSVAGNIGGNLVAEQIQRWADRGDDLTELEVAQWVAEQSDHPDIREALDAILLKLEAIPRAQAGLVEDDRQWFTETLRGELTRLGNLARFEVFVGGDIAGRDHINAGRDYNQVGGDQVGRDKITVEQLVVVDQAYLQRLLKRPSPPEDLRQATQCYLNCLTDRYRYLDFKGMGVSDRVPLRLQLLDLYVPLRARVELPPGETWARPVRLAGRQLPDDDPDRTGERLSDPLPLLDMLDRCSGLIILGDPGAGKTTFLKRHLLQLAASASPPAVFGAAVPGAVGGIEEGPRLPLLLPLSAYANALAERTVRLDDFIADHFHKLGADLPIGDMLRQALAAGSAVVMLDGLDEVKDLSLRDTVVRCVLDFYTFHRRAGNKFLLTSRIVGYREVRPVAEGLTECTLVDFDDEEIEDFVARWTLAIEYAMHGAAAHGRTQVAGLDAERERVELLAAVQHNPGVRQLAANPLLLTILALMKRQGMTLPERRVELYQKYVETLLSSWNRARGLGRPPSRDLDVTETMRVLAPLALWMHETSPGVGLVKQPDLLRRLQAIYTDRGQDDPERASRQFLADVREHAGLLLERGASQYGFIHLTFEEYLAAVALAQQGQQSVEPVVAALTGHVDDPAWHETSLLTVGYLGVVQGRDQAAGAVIDGLLAYDAGQVPPRGQAVALAGEAVADAGPGGVTAASRDRLIQALLRTMEDDQHVQPRERAAAGRAMARLGDPRPGVTSLDGMEFCRIPAGPFWMGSEENKDERPMHINEHLDYDYWIGRYPVTVAQFRAFVQASGHKPRDEDSLRGLANHPVVNVTWHDVCAFCDWLTQRWLQQGRLPAGWAIRLPSEVEWEKAARGGVETQHVASLVVGCNWPAAAPARLQANDNPKRVYPWGDDPDPDRANCKETGIGTTSAVGCFPGGVSPYGCLDMAGNVWEWTRSLWGKDWDEPEFKYPYNPADGRENFEAGNDVWRILRGGSWRFDASAARCAFRRGNALGGYWLDSDGFRIIVSPISLPLRATRSPMNDADKHRNKRER